jgi:S1-C subfamily serine protease
MKRQVLYSPSRRPSGAVRDDARPAPPLTAPGAGGGADPAASAARAGADQQESRQRFARLRAFGQRHAGWLRFFAGAALVAAIGATYLAALPQPVPLRQEDIDAAVLNTLENRNLPSRAAKAAESVRPSLVRVRGFAEAGAVKGKGSAQAKRPAPKLDSTAPRKGAKDESVPEGMEPISLGSGVVIVDDGTILTNLHVVYGAKHLSVTFHDGTEADAEILSVHPENDLAVIRAKKIPDDLPAATLGSASRLKPGDEVVAVGFPFGMGPSVSYGVVSGLNREFRSQQGERVLTRLIQFDAMANPGSSGGPLVTMQGDVVGIVTAILNPHENGTFIGIGFAVTIGVAGRAAGMHPF